MTKKIKLIIVIQIIIVIFIITNSYLVQARYQNVSVNGLKPINGILSAVHLMRDSVNGFPTPEFEDKVDELFTWVIAPNAGKMDRMHYKSRYEYSWDGIDLLQNWAVEHNKEFKYHSVVWNNNLVPNWYKNLNQTERRKALEDHVRNVTSRFKGKVKIYDIINEPHNQHKVFPGYIGTGWDNVEAMVNILNWTVDEDPDAMLLLNEFDLIEVPSTRQGFINLINDIQAAGGQIDGIGVQAHLGYVGRDYPNKLAPDDVINRALDELHEQTGLPLYINELTLCVPDGRWGCLNNDSTSNPHEGFDSYYDYRAWAFHHVIKLFLEHDAVEWISLWEYYVAAEPPPRYYTTYHFFTERMGCSLVDNDGDEFPAAPCGYDCNDNDPNIYPIIAPELCDG